MPTLAGTPAPPGGRTPRRLGPTSLRSGHARAEQRPLAIRARIGVVRTALVIGEFEEAQREGMRLKADAPTDIDVLCTHADAIWSAGLFDEAE